MLSMPLVMRLWWRLASIVYLKREINSRYLIYTHLPCHISFFLLKHLILGAKEERFTIF